MFASLLETLFIERMDQNVDISSRFVGDGKFRKVVSAWMAGEVYQRLQTRKAEAEAKAHRPTLVEEIAN